MTVDEVAIRQFLHTSYPRIVAAVALASGSRAAAEDAVQEALLRAWERSERGDDIEVLDAWVAAVALNLSRSAIRRVLAERRARSRVAARLGTTPDLGVATERSVDVERALATLPRRQREAVVLRYYLQLDTREAAAALGVSAGTVKSTLSRARAALARELDEHEEHDTEEANDRGTR